uniref:ATP-dependent DNA helicase n=1 Tax=Lactuca sativa TaxID=4236 RepID=A0A9R1XBH5_LACSA|nr:hypothetical protein LSAT_V11C600309880 [Lactuca sativa]
MHNMVLIDIRIILHSLGKKLSDYGLLDVNGDINLQARDLHAKDSLNPNRKFTYDEIIRHVEENIMYVFFIDGHGGTGKTFLYTTLLANTRADGLIALATTMSGVATNNIPGGRTTHSRFKIPLTLYNNSMCKINKQSGAAHLLREEKVIIWDEALIAKRQEVESVMEIGGRMDESFIRIHDDMDIKYTNKDNSVDALIDAIFPSLQSNEADLEIIISMINCQMIKRFSREKKVYYNYDEVGDDSNNLYLTKFLNSLNVSGLPPSDLRLKISCLVILSFQQNVINAEIAVDAPIQIEEKAIPLRLSFSMTINKSQGQTIPNVGVYLPKPVFSHGQLYVALSRGISCVDTKVLVMP